MESTETSTLSDLVQARWGMWMLPPQWERPPGTTTSTKVQVEMLGHSSYKWTGSMIIATKVLPNAHLITPPNILHVLDPA